MATFDKNLSNYDKKKIPNAADFKIGIVISEWNEEITANLLKGVVETLLENGCRKERICTQWVPGAFELPFGAQHMLEKGELNAVICVGSVIQGETKHFDYVCQTAAAGIKDVSLKYNKPVIFCVLTDNTKQQAIDRSGGMHGNKGVEAAVACLKMISLTQS
jgi:6,7-dimethyl-8-ribityllumazine synthase